MNRKAEKEEKREEFAPVGMQESKTICRLTPFARVVGLQVKSTGKINHTSASLSDEADRPKNSPIVTFSWPSGPGWPLPGH